MTSLQLNFSNIKNYFHPLRCSLVLREDDGRNDNWFRSKNTMSGDSFPQAMEEIKPAFNRIPYMLSS